MGKSTYRKPPLFQEVARNCSTAQDFSVKSSAIGYRVAPEVVSPGVLQCDTLVKATYHVSRLRRKVFPNDTFKRLSRNWVLDPKETATFDAEMSTCGTMKVATVSEPLRLLID